MSTLQIYMLKALRKLYARIFDVKPLMRPECICDPEISSRLIYDRLISDEPCMVARFGAFELKDILVNYLGVKKETHSIWKYIKGKELDWWWNPVAKINNDFIPTKTDEVLQYCKMMENDIPLVDILGSWLPYERYFEEQLVGCKKIDFELLNPYFSKTPWTIALKHKRVLVVHPFSISINAQYQKRDLLFDNKDTLPEFELITFKSVYGLGKHNNSPFDKWFDALNYMKAEIDKIDYDICLIGCGSYGFPLAAHVKRMGKKSVLMGGSLQLLFGIRGKRWESTSYSDQYDYSVLMNEHWVRPCEEEVPNVAKKIEGGCYL